MASKGKSYKESVGPVVKGYKRGTYYLTPELMMRLKIHAATHGTDQSDVVREALHRFVDPLAKRP